MGLQGLFAVPSKIFANFDFALTYTLVMKQPFMKTPQLVLATCVGLLLSPLAQGGSLHAFIWNSSTGMQDLGTLGGNTSYAIGINDNGEVVGYSYLADNVTTHAFTWTAAGGMVDLGSLPGGTSTQGSCINNAGNVGGNGIDANGRQVPFFWSATGGFQTLPENTGDSRNYSFGINDRDELTGQQYGSGNSGEIVHAFFWAPIDGIKQNLPPLTGGLHTVGNSINNKEQITGTASVPNNGSIFHAFVWSQSGGTRDIGGVPGQTYTAGVSINAKSEIVGFGGSGAVGFYWSRATRMVLLQTLGGLQSAAFSINNTGAIAGYSTNSGGAIHAVLWPDKSSAPQDLGTLPGGTNSYGRFINSVGQVAGYADVP